MKALNLRSLYVMEPEPGMLQSSMAFQGQPEEEAVAA
jgi:hypothetical protein